VALVTARTTPSRRPDAVARTLEAGDAKNGIRMDPVRQGQPGGRGGRADRHPAPSWPVYL